MSDKWEIGFDASYATKRFEKLVEYCPDGSKKIRLILPARYVKDVGDPLSDSSTKKVTLILDGVTYEQLKDMM